MLWHHLPLPGKSPPILEIWCVKLDGSLAKNSWIPVGVELQALPPVYRTAQPAVVFSMERSISFAYGCKINLKRYFGKWGKFCIFAPPELYFFYHGSERDPPLCKIQKKKFNILDLRSIEGKRANHTRMISRIGAGSKRGQRREPR